MENDTGRLARRTTILKGKRSGAFDPDQYYAERASRARIARKARIRLRRMEPLVLVTPRWSEARRFLDDLATDLLVGVPAVRARTLSLHPLQGRTPHQAWSWLVLAMTEFCCLPLEGPAWQVVSRRGFRHVMRDLFAGAEEGERRCLMLHGLENVHVEALRDLIDVFSEHVAGRSGPAHFNLLLAGAIDAPHFEFEGVERLVLPDFADFEALEALVESVGSENLQKLKSITESVGGIPAVLDALSQRAPERLSELVAERRAVWKVAGPIAGEIRKAVDIVTADELLLSRFEQIAREGPLPPDPRDEALIRAGLVRQSGPQGTRRTSLRAPFLQDCV